MDRRTQKKRVMFLFGAGAEGYGNFNLVSGYEYLKNSLFGNEYKKEITTALKQFFNNNYFASYKYTAHTYSNKLPLIQNIIIKKIFDNKELLIEHAETISYIIDDKDFKLLSEDESIRTIIKANNIEHKFNREARNKILTDFTRIITEDFKYDDIENELLKRLFEKGRNGNAIIDMNIAIGGFLDNYFHTIISPDKYGSYSFSKVFNYYWLCYFTIIEGIIKKFIDNSALAKYYTFDKHDDVIINYTEILNDINAFTKTIYELDIQIGSENTYYKLIREWFEESKKYTISDVVTTNYFKFAEIVKSDVVYLNGKLSEFELPEVLEVHDARKSVLTNAHIFFPFIFGQSLIKPIVNETQIKSFSSFSNALNNADILIVLGFNINEDDNHINAFLHNYAKEKKILIVGSSDSKKGKEDVEKRLRLKDCNNIHYCTVRYGKKPEDNRTVINKMMKSLDKIYEGELNHGTF